MKREGEKETDDAGIPDSKGLSLFNESYSLSDRMLSRLSSLRSQVRSGGGGGGGKANKRLEEEMKRARSEIAEKTRRLGEAERLIKRAQADAVKCKEEQKAAEERGSKLTTEIKEMEGSRDAATAQVAECRGLLLKEHKGRHALMLRRERLEAEVVRLRCELDIAKGAGRAMDGLEERRRRAEADLSRERAARERLEQQVMMLGHLPCTEEVSVDDGRDAKRRKVAS